MTTPPMQQQPRSHPPPSPAVTSGVHAALNLKRKKTPPPILASEALREDLAPMHPARAAIRVCHAGAAAALIAALIAQRSSLGLGATHGSLAIGLASAVAMLLTAVAPFGYRHRATAGGLIGLGVMCVGLIGLGPLAVLGPAAGRAGVLEWPLWHEVAAVVLPAALLFRAHYRAYARGRTVLGFAYGLSMPFALGEVIRMLSDTPGTAPLGAALTLLVTVAGLFAFWGTPPNSVTSWLVTLYALALTTDVVLAADPTATASLEAALCARAIAGVVLFASLLAASLGVFQLLVHAYARDARQVDVRKSVVPEIPVARPSSGE